MGPFTSTFTYKHSTTLKPPQSTLSEPSATVEPISEACYQAALALLHDPSAIITLNPLVTHFEEVDSSFPDLKRLLSALNSSLNARDLSQSTDPRWKFFRITDAKPMLKGWYTYTFCYHISYLILNGGCDTAVAAPGGVSIEGSWRVCKDGGTGQDKDEELTLEEKATVTCPSIFAPFIKATLASSHGEMHDRFAEKWKERLSAQESRANAR